MLARLNAPFGARCFMTGSRGRVMSNRGRGLNASFGAWCFMTMYPNELATADLHPRFNAPFGARCFMTQQIRQLLKIASES